MTRRLLVALLAVLSLESLSLTSSATAPSGSSVPPTMDGFYSMHVSSKVSGFHQHYFQGATATLGLASNDMVYCWVYLDPENPPTEVMLQFLASPAGPDWIRVYWGANQLGLGTNMGPLPATGQWVKLLVLNSTLGSPSALQGMDFTLVGGVAYWGTAGRERLGIDYVWVGNGTPAGATLYSNNENWQWIAPYRRNWLQFGGDPAHSGNNTSEMMIGLDNVSNLQPMSGYNQGGGAGDPSPVLLTNVLYNGVRHDILYANFQGVLSTFDAFTGLGLWSASRYIAPEKPSNLRWSPPPAIDPMFGSPSHYVVYSVGLDGCLHKVALDTGGDYFGPGLGTLNGSPPSQCLQNGWPALLTANSIEMVKTAVTVAVHQGVPYAYVGTTAEDENGSGSYQGSIVAVNLNTGTQQRFNSMCGTINAPVANNDPAFPTCHTRGGSIWMRGGLTFDGLTQRVLGATGNFNQAGPVFSPPNLWAGTLLALNADGTGAGGGNPVDSWTALDPTPFASTADLDLSSTNTLILANNGSSFPHLAAQGGKDGNIRLINLDNMSGGGTPGLQGNPLTTIPLAGGCSNDSCAINGPMATWVNSVDNTTWIFANAVNGMNAIQLAAGSTSASGQGWTALSSTTATNALGAFVANGVLYYADHNAFPPPPAAQCPTGSQGRLWALNAATGTALWSACHSVTGHVAPVVINGVLYFGGNAYSVGGVSPLGMLPSINVAAGGQTHQMLTPLSPLGDSSLGVDDNTDGNYFDNSVFHTDNTATTISGYVGGPWWEVFTPGVQQVSQVILYNRTDNNLQGRLGGFRILYYTGSSWQLAADYSGYTTSSSNPVIVVPVNIPNPAYVMVQKVASGGQNYLHLAEVRVIGH